MLPQFILEHMDLPGLCLKHTADRMMHDSDFAKIVMGLLVEKSSFLDFYVELGLAKRNKRSLYFGMNVRPADDGLT